MSYLFFARATLQLAPRPSTPRPNVGDLRFQIQKQERSNWCWVSILHGLNRHPLAHWQPYCRTVTQADVADMVSTALAITPKLSAGNDPFSFDWLTRFGLRPRISLGRMPTVSGLDGWLREGNVVACTLRWHPDLHDHHYVTVAKARWTAMITHYLV